MENTHKLLKYLKEKGFKTEDIQIFTYLLSDLISKNTEMLIEFYLTEKDIRAIEAVVIKNNFNELERSELFVRYFEDKTKITLDDIIKNFLDDLYNLMVKQDKFFEKVIERVKDIDNEELQKKEFLAYMKDFISFNEDLQKKK